MNKHGICESELFHFENVSSEASAWRSHSIFKHVHIYHIGDLVFAPMH